MAKPWGFLSLLVLLVLSELPFIIRSNKIKIFKKENFVFGLDLLDALFSYYTLAYLRQGCFIVLESATVVFAPFTLQFFCYRPASLPLPVFQGGMSYYFQKHIYKFGILNLDPILYWLRKRIFCSFTVCFLFEFVSSSIQFYSCWNQSCIIMIASLRWLVSGFLYIGI